MSQKELSCSLGGGEGVVRCFSFSFSPIKSSLAGGCDVHCSDGGTGGDVTGEEDEVCSKSSSLGSLVASGERSGAEDVLTTVERSGCVCSATLFSVLPIVMTSSSSLITSSFSLLPCVARNEPTATSLAGPTSLLTLSLAGGCAGEGEEDVCRVVFCEWLLMLLMVLVLKLE